ncbi:MAG TPA: hypothetical protein VKZ18_12010 [Polyangia bacterium]|nr:hypothetical protein [Polyangia bacterium]
MTSQRRWSAIGVLAWAAISACQSSLPGKTTPLVCKSFSSAEELCAAQPCDATWAAVATNHVYCQPCSLVPGCSASDCGGYHVLHCMGLDSASISYYRADTGTLAAIESWGAPNLTDTCMAVGAETFSAPASCDTDASYTLPGWCPSDAGPDPACGDSGASP